MKCGRVRRREHWDFFLLVCCGWIMPKGVGLEGLIWVDDVIWVGDVRTRDEVVVTALQHEAGEVAHDRLRLEMEVTKHFIRPPVANQLDDIRVDTGNKESHGAACT